MKKTNNEILRVKYIKNISIISITLVIFPIILYIILRAKDNKALLLLITSLVYINIRLIIEAFISDYKVLKLWGIIEKTIIDMEDVKKSVDNSLIVLLDERASKLILDEDYSKLFLGIKKLLSQVKSLEYNIKKNEEANTGLMENIVSKLDKPLNDIIINIERLKVNSLENNSDEILNNIQCKSILIKNIIEELFEVSNITSGDNRINLNKVDMKALVKQVLIEYEEKIAKSNIIFKLKILKEKTYIYADGEKLCRVLEILIDNALKHSLKGSRVYFCMELNDKNVIISIKNTSEKELDIKVEELISLIDKDEIATGLSLEIVRKLIEVQGGSFRIDIDADLFKIKLTFPIMDKEELSSAN